MIFGLDCTESSKCDVHIFNKYPNNSNYDQTDCIFCCKKFNNDIITLSCKHTYHLHCFINYTKMNYLTDKNTNVECPLCKNNNDILDIFNKYKVILELRSLWTTKHKIVKNIYVYKDIYSNNNNTFKTNPEIKNLKDQKSEIVEIKNSKNVELKNQNLEIKNQNLEIKNDRYNKYKKYHKYKYDKYYRYYKYYKYDYEKCK